LRSRAGDGRATGANASPSSPRCRVRSCRWKNWSRRYGFANGASVTACNVAVLDLEKPGSGAEAKLDAEIVRALEKGAEAIVLGCAGMADLAEKLSQKFGVPVVDGVAAAVKQAEALAGLRLKTSRRGAYALPAAKDYTGLLAPFAPKDTVKPSG
jgi:Hydantoin racemase